MIKVNCWNEYDTLKTVILGTQFEQGKVPVLYKDAGEQDAFEQVIEETHQDFRGIQQVLEQNGVTVLRPTQPKNYNLLLGTSIKNHNPLLNMRDFHMAYGNMFFMTHGSYHVRRFQHSWLEDIANQMINDGNIVVAANEPNMDTYRNSIADCPDRLTEWSDNYNGIFKNKNLLHTACILKYNKTAFISKNPGTETGKKWIKNLLALQGVELREIDGFGHLDAENAILREDVLLTTTPNNPQWGDFKYKITTASEQKQSKFEEIKQELYQNKIWDKPSSWLKEWQGYFQEFRTLHNCLSLSPSKVLFSKYDKEVFAKLKSMGIEAIYVQWRHSAMWGGGLHCITCDIERDS